MLVFIYLLFIVIQTLSVESSLIRSKSLKSDVGTYTNSKPDLLKKSANSLKIISNEPFIIQLEVPKTGETNLKRNGKEKKRKWPSQKKFPKLKLSRKRHRVRRDLGALDFEDVSKNQKSKLNVPKELVSDFSSYRNPSKEERTNFNKSSVTRQDIIKTLSQLLNDTATSNNPADKNKDYEDRNPNKNDQRHPLEWLKNKIENIQNQTRHQDNVLKKKSPIYQKSHKYSHADLMADRNRVEKKIKNLKQLLSLNDTGYPEDGIRVRRRTETDRVANKIAKMFLTLSAVNGLHSRRKGKCKDDDENESSDENESGFRDNDGRNLSVKRFSSSNEERYKIKKWIEEMKSKRSSGRVCPCRMNPYGNNEEDADMFPLERKYSSGYTPYERSSEESVEAFNRYAGGYPRSDYFNHGKSYRDDSRYRYPEKLMALTKRGRRKLELPLEDLELYRTRAKKILQNAEEILDKIKDEEEKRRTSPNYMMTKLRELTSRIQGDPRNNDNDLIRMLQKNLGFDTKENEKNTFTGNVKSYILDPYEKAKALTEESTRQLSAYLLRNLGKLPQYVEEKERSTEEYYDPTGSETGEQMSKIYQQQQNVDGTITSENLLKENIKVQESKSYADSEQSEDVIKTSSSETEKTKNPDNNQERIIDIGDYDKFRDRVFDIIKEQEEKLQRVNEENTQTDKNRFGDLRVIDPKTKERESLERDTLKSENDRIPSGEEKYKTEERIVNKNLDTTAQQETNWKETPELVLDKAGENLGDSKFKNILGDILNKDKEFRKQEPLIDQRSEQLKGRSENEAESQGLTDKGEVDLQKQVDQNEAEAFKERDENDVTASEYLQRGYSKSKPSENDQLHARSKEDLKSDDTSREATGTILSETQAKEKEVGGKSKEEISDTKKPSEKDLIALNKLENEIKDVIGEEEIPKQQLNPKSEPEMTAKLSSDDRDQKLSQQEEKEHVKDYLAIEEDSASEDSKKPFVAEESPKDKSEYVTDKDVNKKSMRVVEEDSTNSGGLELLKEEYPTALYSKNSNEGTSQEALNRNQNGESKSPEDKTLPGGTKFSKQQQTELEEDILKSVEKDIDSGKWRGDTAEELDVLSKNPTKGKETVPLATLQEQLEELIYDINTDKNFITTTEREPKDVGKLNYEPEKKSLDDNLSKYILNSFFEKSDTNKTSKEGIQDVQVEVETTTELGEKANSKLEDLGKVSDVKNTEDSNVVEDEMPLKSSKLIENINREENKSENKYTDDKHDENSREVVKAAKSDLFSNLEENQRVQPKAMQSEEDANLEDVEENPADDDEAVTKLTKSTLGNKDSDSFNEDEKEIFKGNEKAVEADDGVEDDKALLETVEPSINLHDENLEAETKGDESVLESTKSSSESSEGEDIDKPLKASDGFSKNDKLSKDDNMMAVDSGTSKNPRKVEEDMKDDISNDKSDESELQLEEPVMEKQNQNLALTKDKEYENTNEDGKGTDNKDVRARGKESGEVEDEAGDSVQEKKSENVVRDTDEDNVEVESTGTEDEDGIDNLEVENRSDEDLGKQSNEEARDTENLGRISEDKTEKSDEMGETEYMGKDEVDDIGNEKKEDNDEVEIMKDGQENKEVVGGMQTADTESEDEMRDSEDKTKDTEEGLPDDQREATGEVEAIRKESNNEENLKNFEDERGESESESNLWRLEDEEKENENRMRDREDESKETEDGVGAFRNGSEEGEEGEKRKSESNLWGIEDERKEDEKRMKDREYESEETEDGVGAFRNGSEESDEDDQDLKGVGKEYKLRNMEDEETEMNENENESRSLKKEKRKSEEVGDTEESLETGEKVMEKEEGGLKNEDGLWENIGTESQNIFRDKIGERKETEDEDRDTNDGMRGNDEVVALKHQRTESEDGVQSMEDERVNEDDSQKNREEESKDEMRQNGDEVKASAIGGKQSDYEISDDEDERMESGREVTNMGDRKSENEDEVWEDKQTDNKKEVETLENEMKEIEEEVQAMAIERAQGQDEASDVKDEIGENEEVKDKRSEVGEDWENKGVGVLEGKKENDESGALENGGSGRKGIALEGARKPMEDLIKEKNADSSEKKERKDGNGTLKNDKISKDGRIQGKNEPKKADNKEPKYQIMTMEDREYIDYGSHKAQPSDNVKEKESNKHFSNNQNKIPSNPNKHPRNDDKNSPNKSKLTDLDIESKKPEGKNFDNTMTQQKKPDKGLENTPNEYVKVKNTESSKQGNIDEGFIDEGKYDGTLLEAASQVKSPINDIDSQALYSNSPSNVMETKKLFPIHPQENLQNLDSQPKQSKKLQVPKSIGKIMKDLEKGQVKDDITSIQNLNNEKIDHLIDKIYEAQNQASNTAQEEADCRKQCACADEIDAKAQDRGRYEIVKDFLHWMKDLQLNRVLSDD